MSTASGPRRADSRDTGRPAADLRGVLPAGTSLRGYELKAILGQGAFGITYRARDLNLDRDVAIKEYLPTSLALREGSSTVLPRSPDHAEQFTWGRERFLEEARTLARLDRTPAIVRVHDFLEANGTAYMVMALVEGETLARRLARETRLGAEAVERILFPLLDGLEEVHGIGFLHRDIKPANIMIDGAGRATLIDFGASRAAMAERSTTMTAIFTPGYAAAEQFTSAKLGPWTDIYGLAATMYHAITGTISPSSIDRILSDSCEPLAELRPEGFAPELLVGIDAGLAIRAEERPQTIAAWRHTLRSGELPLPSVEVTQVARRRRRGRSGVALQGPALWSAAAATLLLLVGSGWLAWQASVPPNADAAALGFSTEQLERALAERRKAETLAAEKRQIEDEARQKADAETESKRQAETELQRAREARQQAEQELEQLKARIATSVRDSEAAQRDQQAAIDQREREAEAQRAAEAQAASLRAAEEEARQRAEADAEAKRKADEALAAAEAERLRAEQVAQARLEAEQAIQRALEEAQRLASDSQRRVAEAETAEKAMRLDQADRQRLQAALSALGFDTRGQDGRLGPRSREMIAGWQKARKLEPTGFLDAPQRQQLLKEAAPALAKLEEQQKADEDAKARAAIPAAAVRPAAAIEAAPAPASEASTRFDGSYSAGMYSGSVKFSLQLARGSGTVTITAPGCETTRIPVTISSDGAVVGRKTYVNCAAGAGSTGSNLRPGDFEIDGYPQGERIRLWFRNPTNTFSLDLRPDRAGGGAARYDGTWIGLAGMVTPGGSRPPTARLTLQQGRGSVVFEKAGCEPSTFPISMSAAGEASGEGVLNCPFFQPNTLQIGVGTYTVEGRLQGDDLHLAFRNSRNNFDTVLRRERPASAPGK